MTQWSTPDTCQHAPGQSAIETSQGNNDQESFTLGYKFPGADWSVILHLVEHGHLGRVQMPFFVAAVEDVTASSK